MKITHHFRVRCVERLGPQVSPDDLAALIAGALAEGREDVVRFACKTGRGRRVYRCQLEGRGDVYALVESDHSTLLTVMLPGFAVQRPGKRKRKLLRGVLH